MIMRGVFVDVNRQLLRIIFHMLLHSSNKGIREDQSLIDLI